MLKKRITEEYVDDSCKALEDKIKREVYIFMIFDLFMPIYALFLIILND